MFDAEGSALPPAIKRLVAKLERELTTCRLNLSKSSGGSSRHVSQNGREAVSTSVTRGSLDPVLTTCNLPPVLVTNSVDVVPIPEGSHPHLPAREVKQCLAKPSRARVTERKLPKIESSQRALQFLIRSPTQCSPKILSRDNAKRSQSSQDLNKNLSLHRPQILKTEIIPRGPQFLNAKSPHRGYIFLKKAVENSQCHVLIVNNDGQQRGPLILNKDTSQRGPLVLNVGGTQTSPLYISAEGTQHSSQLQNGHAQRGRQIQDIERPQQSGAKNNNGSSNILYTKEIENNSHFIQRNDVQCNPQYLNTEGIQYSSQMVTQDLQYSSYVNGEALPYAPQYLNMQASQTDLQSQTVQIPQNDSHILHPDNLQNFTEYLNNVNLQIDPQSVNVENLQYATQPMNTEALQNSSQLQEIVIAQHDLPLLSTESVQAANVDQSQGDPWSFNTETVQSSLQQNNTESSLPSLQPFITENPELNSLSHKAQASHHSLPSFSDENLQPNSQFENAERSQQELQPHGLILIPQSHTIENPKDDLRSLTVDDLQLDSRSLSAKTLESVNHSPKSDDLQCKQQKTENSQCSLKSLNAESSQCKPKILTDKTSPNVLQSRNVKKRRSVFLNTDITISDPPISNKDESQSDSSQSSDSDSLPLKPKQCRVFKNADIEINGAPPPTSRATRRGSLLQTIEDTKRRSQVSDADKTTRESRLRNTDSHHRTQRSNFLHRERRPAFLNAVISIHESLPTNPESSHRSSRNHNTEGSQHTENSKRSHRSREAKKSSHFDIQPMKTESKEVSKDPKATQSINVELSEHSSPCPAHTSAKSVLTHLPEADVANIDPQLLDVETSDVDTHLLDTANSEQEVIEVDNSQDSASELIKESTKKDTRHDSLEKSKHVNHDVNKNLFKGDDNAQLFNTEGIEQITGPTNAVDVDHITKIFDELVSEKTTELLSADILEINTQQVIESSKNLVNSSQVVAHPVGSKTSDLDQVIDVDEFEFSVQHVSTKFLKKDEIVNVVKVKKRRTQSQNAEVTISVSSSSDEEDSLSDDSSLNSTSSWSTDDDEPLSPQPNISRQTNTSSHRDTSRAANTPHSETSQRNTDSSQSRMSRHTVADQSIISRRDTDSPQPGTSQQDVSTSSSQRKRSRKSTLSRQRKISRRAFSGPQPSSLPPDAAFAEMPAEISSNISHNNPIRDLAARQCHFFRSSRGRRMLMVGNIKYRINSIRPDKVRWRCASHERFGCRARIHTNGNKIVYFVDEHTTDAGDSNLDRVEPIGVVSGNP